MMSCMCGVKLVEPLLTHLAKTRMRVKGHVGRNEGVDANGQCFEFCGVIQIVRWDEHASCHNATW